MKGELQPFGYTGYQRDRTAGSYFAQAREYLPEVGRFMGRDLIKGLADFPFTLNEYGYCWNNPLMLMDRNGALPEFIENAVEWGKEHKGAVVAAVGVAALAVAAAAFAPVVLAGGAAAGVTAGVLAKVAVICFEKGRRESVCPDLHMGRQHCLSEKWKSYAYLSAG